MVVSQVHKTRSTRLRTIQSKREKEKGEMERRNGKEKWNGERRRKEKSQTNTAE